MDKESLERTAGSPGLSVRISPFQVDRVFVPQDGILWVLLFPPPPPLETSARRLLSSHPAAPSARVAFCQEFCPYCSC